MDGSIVKASEATYASCIRAAFHYLLATYPECFAIGQGLWSPWYVGTTMTDLDKDFGPDRVIDTPVSEQACTGTAIGASLCGYRPIVIHPRMDFMILATDQDIINILGVELEVVVMWIDRTNPSYPPPADAIIQNVQPDFIDPTSQNYKTWVGHVRLRTVRVNDIAMPNPNATPSP